MRYAAVPTLALLVLLTITPTGRCERVSESEMEQACENWLRHIVSQTGSWAGVSDPSVSVVEELLDGDRLLARVYSIDPAGFVVVPILRQLPPIKAYSDECKFNVGDTGGMVQMIRDILRNRLSAFRKEYGSLDARPGGRKDGGFDDVHRRQWDRLLAGSLRTPLTEMGPLLTTRWHQEQPFNDLCPMGDGGRCVVGCLATALVQVMKYHDWPPSGGGSHSYMWSGDNSCGGSTSGDELSAFFQDPYDWENMPDFCYDECTPEENGALAELSYEAGVALEMDYGACGSASTFLMVEPALTDFFLYEPVTDFEERCDHSLGDWFDIIKSEINARRPMLYGIPFHAIVCDGWREADSLCQYHMNYGWGGSQNAWYTLDELYWSPDPCDEGMIRRITPGNRTVRVRADGLGDYPTIQAAIDSVPAGVTIELENGTYAGPGNRDLDFLGKEIGVCSLSGDPDLCIIDCEGLGRAFFLHSGEGLASSVRGITLTHGYVSGTSPDNGGGAVYCAGVRTVIENCKIVDNHADGDGGAVFCDSASVAIINCTIADNTSGGSGGGLCFADSSHPEITDCTVTHNTAQLSGGGIAAGPAVWPTLSGTTLAANSALAASRGSGGGGLACGPGAIIEDCAVVDNFSSASGGGILLEPADGPEPHIDGCTISGNRAGTTGGGMQYDGGVSFWIESSILWYNCADTSGDDLFLLGDPVVHFSGCDVDSNGIAGAGATHWAWYNQHVPPGFCDPADCRSVPTVEGDYHLKENSPCAPQNAPMGALVGALGIGCPPGVHTVRPDGSGDFPTIQAAVDSVPWYDTVELSSGTYVGTGNRDVDFLGKALTVCSGSRCPDSVVIDCEEQGRAFAFQSGEGAGSILENLTITGGRALQGAAVYCDGTSPTLTGCVFHGNTADQVGGAVFCAGSARPCLESCTLVGNSAPTGGGVHSRGSLPVIQRSILASSTQGEAVGCDSSGTATLSCCDLYGNAGGDWVGCVADSGTINGNFTADPLFEDPASGDYHLQVSSPCLDAPGCGQVGALGKGFFGNRAWHVPADAPTIQAGIDSAWAGDSVLVAPGTYFEHGIEMKSGVLLRSESASASDVIINADGLGRILTCVGVDSTTVIEGLTLTGGLATGLVWPNNAGGAIYCENAQPVFIGCCFAGNEADYGGGLAAKDACPTIRSSTLTSNAASTGAGIYAYYTQSSIALERCIISHSTNGQAVHCYYGATATVSCSDIFGNAGGDWTGCIADQYGLDGNVSADPLFCNASGGDYRLHEDSPCVPENSPTGCGLVGALDTGCASTSTAEVGSDVPMSLLLGPAVPNPFNPVTEVTYGIPAGRSSLRVTLSVYDATGRRVRTLVDEVLGAGIHRAVWEGTDHRGTEVASGVYFYRITWNGQSRTRRMVLLK